MELMNPRTYGRARYYQMQTSATLQKSIWFMSVIHQKFIWFAMDLLQSNRFGMLDAFTVCLAQGKVLAFITMAPGAASAPPSCLWPKLDTGLWGRLVFGNKSKFFMSILFFVNFRLGIAVCLNSKSISGIIGQLSNTPAIRPVPLFLQLQTYCLCPKSFTVLFHYALVSASDFLCCLSSFVYLPLLNLLTMVRHSQRSRLRGSRGGRGRPQVARSVNPARRPSPYHGFQTNHFTFQSNLNRPVITVNFTILFSEEDSPTPIRVCMMSEPPQEAFREAGNQSNLQVMAKETLEKGKGERLERSDAPSASLRPDAAGQRNVEDNDSDSRPLLRHLGNENVGCYDDWEDTACQVVEEPRNEDTAI